MKKILFTLALLFIAFSNVNAQSYAISETPKQLVESKTSGTYTFTMGSDITPDKIDEVSKYYTENLKISFDLITNKTIVKLLNNDEQSRMIIGRFLIAAGASNVHIGDEIITVGAFMEKYLK
jgi:hypothetical protein